MREIKSKRGKENLLDLVQSINCQCVCLYLSARELKRARGRDESREGGWDRAIAHTYTIENNVENSDRDLHGCMDLVQKYIPCLHCTESGAGSGTAVRAQRLLLYYKLYYE